MRMHVRTAQKLLISEWLVIGGGLFLILIGQWLFGHYGDRWQESLSWFSATILPTLTLVLGGFVPKVTGGESTDQEIEKFPFLIAFTVSLVYLVVALGVVLVGPFVSISPLELMKESEVWLHVLQAVSGITLGWFFMSRQE